MPFVLTVKMYLREVVGELWYCSAGIILMVEYFVKIIAITTFEFYIALKITKWVNIFVSQVEYNAVTLT